MIFTTPRASCSMKSLRAHRASILVACSPGDRIRILINSNRCSIQTCVSCQPRHWELALILNSCHLETIRLETEN